MYKKYSFTSFRNISPEFIFQLFSTSRSDLNGSHFIDVLIVIFISTKSQVNITKVTYSSKDLIRIPYRPGANVQTCD